MSAYDLVKAAKAKRNIPSDNALAVLMGIDNQMMSNWKNGKSKPNGENALYLAELADLKPSDAKLLLQGGFCEVSLLGVTSIGCTLAIAASWVRVCCILCKMEVKRKLPNFLNFKRFLHISAYAG